MIQSIGDKRTVWLKTLQQWTWTQIDTPTTGIIFKELFGKNVIFHESETTVGLNMDDTEDESKQEDKSDQ